MIDLGVATSIAKRYQYSWQHTINYCLTNGLDAIQFYLLQALSIQNITAGNSISKKYLHLPTNFPENHKNIIAACMQFKSFYKSDKLIVHQNEALTIRNQIDIISKLTDSGFVVGIENEGERDLKLYIKLLEKCKLAQKNFFAVLDIHRFFHDYCKIYACEIIQDEIIRILRWCNDSETSILLHVIDSKSFSGDRQYWCPIFNGLVPYSDIFGYIRDKNISIESIILEYETEYNTMSSIEALRREVIFFNKN